jgi:hypothetical protein
VHDALPIILLIPIKNFGEASAEARRRKMGCVHAGTPHRFMRRIDDDELM